MKLRDLQRMNTKVSIDVKKKWYLTYARKSSESEERQIVSIKDQVNALKPIIAEKNLPILDTFGEAKSAKAPGRPVFNEMIELINSRKDIIGIVCWKLNRLSRNPIDTGTLQWLLQTGVIEEIVTPSKTYTEVDSDFIMAVEGAQANRFIRDLKDDTKRGIDSKLEKGLFPGLAPPGYKNNTEKRQGEKDISAHSLYFSLMQKVLGLALTGNFTIQQLTVKAGEMGIKNSRNKAISKTQMAKLLHNPFYAGRFVYGGKLYNGTHPPMLTDDEFDLLQDILSGRSRPRKQKHDFWHTGIPIICGECGCHITGEYKTKHYKNGTSQVFTYARCTKKNQSHKCAQSFMPTQELEKQVIEVLGTMKLSPKFVDWAIKWLNTANQNQKEIRDTRYASLKKSYEDVVKRIDNLIELKISPTNKDNSLISDEEFSEKKSMLIEEKTKAQELLAKVDRHIDEWTEIAAKTFDFAATAEERFINGDIEDRRIILKAVGSHLVLKNKKLTVEARTPFLKIQQAVGEMRKSSGLEPNKEADITLQTVDLQPQNAIWGG